jgi:mRNA-degrading endonuclease YafQ of YafQ-DinJ toxin-antitoxin module
MNAMTKYFALTILILFSSCGLGSEFDDHELVGDYLGSWDVSVVPLEIRMSIVPNLMDDGLVLLVSSLADSRGLELINDTEFRIDRFEENGYSREISGELIQDTLFLENESYLVGNPSDIITNLGKFVKQN